MSVTDILPLKNRIQNYAWGSRSAIARLMGQPEPAPQPEAELWMGDHPQGPSEVFLNGKWRSLRQVISAHAESILGPEAARRYGNRMPFLFKVLAAAQPLSIQAHPGSKRAKEGFARENRQGLAGDDPRRCYKDGTHKPECICALTPMWVLSGFRPAAETGALLESICPAALQPEIEILSRTAIDGDLRDFFNALMTLPEARKTAALDEARTCDQRPGIPQAMADWILRLYRFYPDDIGILAPAYMHLTHLQPGQALFLNPGLLHAYLDGMGIELMANSDNVLRGGLTPKHIDLPELVRNLDFSPRPAVSIKPQQTADHETVYFCDAEEFVLSQIRLKPQTAATSRSPRGIEIILCTAGQAVISDTAGGKAHLLKKGGSVLIPAAAAGYTISGQGEYYKAAMPTKER